jgi:GNAT superfamily N-acetyltransferase
MDRADHTDMNLLRHLKSGFLNLPFQVGLGTFHRMMAVEEFMEKRWSLAAPKRRWYLWIMGGRPKSWGQGLGSALLEAGTSQADEDGLPCSLETHNLDNVSHYGRFGFETIFEGPLPGHDLPVYMMMRALSHPSGF